MDGGCAPHFALVEHLGGELAVQRLYSIAPKRAWQSDANWFSGTEYEQMCLAAVQAYNDAGVLDVSELAR